MLTSTYPFPKDSKHDIINSEPDLELLRKLDYTENCIDLVNKMLHKNPTLRLKISSI